jgi:hypothetical protein
MAAVTTTFGALEAVSRAEALAQLDQLDDADRAREQASTTPQSAPVSGVVCSTADRNGA